MNDRELAFLRKVLAANETMPSSVADYFEQRRRADAKSELMTSTAALVIVAVLMVVLIACYRLT